MKIKGHFMTFGRSVKRDMGLKVTVDWQTDKRVFLKPRISIDIEFSVFFQKTSVYHPINEIIREFTLFNIYNWKIADIVWLRERNFPADIWHAH